MSFHQKKVSMALDNTNLQMSMHYCGNKAVSIIDLYLETSLVWTKYSYILFETLDCIVL